MSVFDNRCFYCYVQAFKPCCMPTSDYFLDFCYLILQLSDFSKWFFYNTLISTHTFKQSYWHKNTHIFASHPHKTFSKFTVSRPRLVIVIRVGSCISLKYYRDQHVGERVIILRIPSFVPLVLSHNIR